MFVALCCTMLTENLGWLLYSEKFILRLLTAEQKEKRRRGIFTGGQNHRQDRKRSATEQIECEDHARCFLRLSRFDTLRVRKQKSNSESRILSGRFTASARKRTKETTGPWEHASATKHATRSIQQFNVINKIPSLPQALYSSNLSLSLS